MEIGSCKYRGENNLFLVQTILKLFLRVLAFVGVMVEKKLEQLVQDRNCFCFVPKPDGDALSISLTPRFCHPRHRQV